MSNVNVSYYLSEPSSPKGVGVIIIQEWWGLDEHIKDLTIKFADNGFISLAPDLYHNKVTKEPDEAQTLMMSMNFEEALNEISIAAYSLKKHCDKIVIAGFCMGGFLALKAGENLEIDGVLAFYPGRYTPTEEDIKKQNAPVHIFFGDKDGGFDDKKYKDIGDLYTKNNNSFSFHLFDGAEHAFMNDTRPSFNKEASDQSWKIVLQFLESIK